MYKEVDLAWAAGLIEGEGCFTLHKGKSLHPYLLLDSTDADVIEKLHSIFPFGNKRGPYRSKKLNHKDRYRFDAYGPKARNIMINIYPYMCSRRKLKINEIMEKTSNSPSITKLPTKSQGTVEVVECKTHPNAPHGFLRNESATQDRYVCECEFWEEPKRYDDGRPMLRKYD